MRMSKMGKKYIAGMTAILFAVVGLKISTAYAANEVDLTKTCSLTLNVGETGTFAEDLATTELHANLYKVATVDSNGKYTSLDAYASLELEKAVQGKSDWGDKAFEAAKLAEGKTPDANIVMTEGTGTADGLEAGMYLVVVENGISEYYEYTFSPYIICLPENLYYQTNDPADNYYQYDLIASLKAEQSPRYGNLEIKKTLTSYNTSLKDVTFVFQIEAVDLNGDTVYSNVVSTTHSAAGTKSIVVEGIPAGATVTVTEVYSGASYEAVGASQMSTVITAEDIVSVEFSNAYDDELVSGYGVTNHFEYDENTGWKWSQLKDNSVAE